MAVTLVRHTACIQNCFDICASSKGFRDRPRPVLLNQIIGGSKVHCNWAKLFEAYSTPLNIMTSNVKGPLDFTEKPYLFRTHFECDLIKVG